MSENRKQVLVRLYTPNGEKTYLMDKSEFIFGRAGKSDIKFNDGAISREHLKVRIEDEKIYVTDLNSSNGTFLNKSPAHRNTEILIQEKSLLSFGKSQVSMRIKFVDSKNNAENDQQPNNENKIAEKKYEYDPKLENTVPLEAVQKDILLNENLVKPKVSKEAQVVPDNRDGILKDIASAGFNLPKYRDQKEEAHAMIEEAQLQKKSILKGAEAQKLTIINEAKIQSKKIQEQAYAEYRVLIDKLLNEARIELNNLRSETDIELHEKKMQSNKEIEELWAEHEEQVENMKKEYQAVLDKEYNLKVELALEKVKTENYGERNRLIQNAMQEIAEKKKTFEEETQKYEEQLSDIKKQIDEYKQSHDEAVQLKSNAQADLERVLSELEAQKNNLESTTIEFDKTKNDYDSLVNQISDFKTQQTEIANQISESTKSLETIKSQINSAADKKNNLENEVNKLTESLEEAKQRAKFEVEAEYKNLKAVELEKFKEYKSNELKELQKMRDAHSESLKNISFDLSREIASKLELQAKKTGNNNFSFDQTFELVNSTIQIKSSPNAEVEPNDQAKLQEWKGRKRSQNIRMISSGFVAALICIQIFNFVYDKLKVDPSKVESQRIAKENEMAQLANRYVPETTDEYHDNYVDSVLFTTNFKEAYLDDENQKEWVNYATKYFLKQWRVEEEKVIQVISNSKALVQDFTSQIPNLKKNRIKNDLAKLKEVEEEYIQKQSSILGTSVRYEAYKKIEKDFFSSRLKEREPASK